MFAGRSPMINDYISIAIKGSNLFQVPIKE